CGVLEARQIQPAAATRTTRDRAVLVTDVAQMLPELVIELGRERPTAHARRVGLGDAEHGVDTIWSDARANRGAAGDRAARRDEGVGAVIDVEQGPLRAF